MTQRTGILSLFNQDLRLKLFLEGTIIGIFVGALIVLFRIILEKAEHLRDQIYIFLKVEGIIMTLLWFLVLIMIGFILAYIVHKIPMSGGSGVPQVKGVILGQFKTNNPILIIISKFFGVILGIGAGLSLGRAGPSIHIGAALGLAISKKLKRLRVEEKYLVTCGASAGLAAAFNAPLAGVIFALEEIHKNFSPTVLISAMAASLSADLLTQTILGQRPIFTFQNLSVLPLKYFLFLIGLGVVCGLLGVIYNCFLLKSLDFYQELRLPKTLHPLIPLLVAGFLGLTIPEVLGGGDNLVKTFNELHFTITMLSIILLIKFLFTMLCYGSGVPGGIYLPLLVLGSLIGNIYGYTIINLFHGESAYIDNFMVYAMAAYFTAIVKAPVTGSILITEMTGSLHHLLPLTFVSMTAYIVADILKSKPIYELLYDRTVKQQKLSAMRNETTTKTIHEFVVSIGSPLEGKRIKNIAWPEGCLLVSVKRGDLDMIPNGNTLLKPGDYLYALVQDEDQQNYEKLLKLTGNAAN